MFRKNGPFQFKSHLKLVNHLKVVFQSAVQKRKRFAAKLSYTLPEKERKFLFESAISIRLGLDCTFCNGLGFKKYTEIWNWLK